MIEARRERESARPAKPSKGRFEAEQTTERAGHADRAVGVGAQRERHHAAGYCGGRSAGGSSGHAAKIVRIACRAVVNVLAGEIVGIFAHVERADEHGAGRFKPLDRGRVAGRGRRIAIDFRSGKRRQSGDVEEVFHRKRHAGERRQALAPSARLVKGLRAQKRTLLGERGEGIDQRIARTDAGEGCLHDARGTAAAGSDRRDNVGGRAPSEIACRHFKHGTPALGRCRRAARIRQRSWRA